MTEKIYIAISMGFCVGCIGTIVGNAIYDKIQIKKIQKRYNNKV